MSMMNLLSKDIFSKKYMVIEKTNQYAIIIKGKNKPLINKREEISLIKNRSLRVVLEGEEIYIKKIILPKSGRNCIDNLVRNELAFCFKNIDDMIFDYLVLEELNSTLEIVVFYINAFNCTFFKDCSASLKNLKSIKLIQFVILKYFKDKIKTDNYIFCFLYNDNLYFILCNKNIIAANSVYKNFKNTMDIEKLCKSFEEKYSVICSDKIQKIYFANFPENYFVKEPVLEDYCVDLGIIENKGSLLKYS